MSAPYDFLLFGLTVDRERVLRRLSAALVAEAAGVTPDAVERAIAGRDPGGAAFVALCLWLDRAPDFFLQPRQVTHA